MTEAFCTRQPYKWPIISLILGEYVFCYSNEFSSFSHKTIYFDFNHGNEDPLTPGIGSQHTALTQIETSSVQIHESLNVIIDYQTHHRLREATSRDNAEYLNERVQYWSIGQAVIILIVSLVQVFVLKNFFAEKRDRIWYAFFWKMIDLEFIYLLYFVH